MGQISLQILANVVYLFLLIQTMYCVDITTKWSINCVVCWIAWYTMMSYQAFLFHISVSNFSRYARDIILPLLSLAFFLLLELPQFSFFFLKTFKLYGPFLWMGFNCLKATATSRRQFTFYHSVPRNSWYSFYRPRKDERGNLLLAILL